MSSRASRRARGRQIEAGRHGQLDVESISGATRQVGALRIGSRDNSVAVDVSKLEAPTQAYDSDTTWIVYRTGRLSLFFGKRSVSEPGTLQSSLEIRYPPEDFLNTWKASSDFFGQLNTYANGWDAAARKVDPLSGPPRPKVTHSEWVTFAAISHSGTEAALDFYHMSTQAIARFTLTHSVEGMKLRPIVRVQMTTFDLLDLVEQLRPIADDIAAKLPAVHQDTVSE
jgi:hypothetical protein